MNVEVGKVGWLSSTAGGLLSFLGFLLVLAAMAGFWIGLGWLLDRGGFKDDCAAYTYDSSGIASCVDRLPSR